MPGEHGLPAQRLRPRGPERGCPPRGPSGGARRPDTPGLPSPRPGFGSRCSTQAGARAPPPALPLPSLPAPPAPGYPRLPLPLPLPPPAPPHPLLPPHPPAPRVPRSPAPRHRSRALSSLPGRRVGAAVSVIRLPRLRRGESDRPPRPAETAAASGLLRLRRHRTAAAASSRGGLCR